MTALEQVRKELQIAVDSITKNIQEVDHFLASGEGSLHHPHELRAMLQGIKNVSEFVLTHEMKIEGLKTPEGQMIVREALSAHRLYEPFASSGERSLLDFEDTTFFLMWLLEFSPSSSGVE